MKVIAHGRGRRRRFFATGIALVAAQLAAAGTQADTPPTTPKDYEYRSVRGNCRELWRVSDLIGTRAQAFSDIDYDGLADVLVAKTSVRIDSDENAGSGETLYTSTIDIRSGRTGERYFTKSFPESPESLSFMAIHDIDRDTVAEIAVWVQAPPGNDGLPQNPPAVRVISGRSGQLLWSRAAPLGETEFGARVVTGADYNHDGLADLVVGAGDFREITSEGGRGRIYVLSSREGSVLRTIDGPEGASAVFGAQLTVAANNPRVLIVGDPWGNFFSGQVYALSTSGKKAVVLWSAKAQVEDATFASGGNIGIIGDSGGDILFGSPIFSMADITRDGVSEVAVGVHNWPDGDGDGRVVVLNGKTGKRLWTSKSRRVGEHFGIVLGDAGDLNRDGVADIVFGADSTPLPVATLGQGGRFGALDARTGRILFGGAFDPDGNSRGKVLAFSCKAD